jgi:NAD(P)H-flavin reductase
VRSTSRSPPYPQDKQGGFELLIKRYAEWGDKRFEHSYRPVGAVSTYVHGLEVGDLVQFKHVAANLKISYPFLGVNTITMVAVGVGLCPMIQAGCVAPSG